ncbi:MAG: putative sulfate exporter family transporter, partial [Anaerolineae bacterium]|nr:putative sulfate exporter family transporter [Anaerolineae bacterium]
WVPGVSAVAPGIGHAAKAGLAVTLFLVGSGMSREVIRATGWKTLLQGVSLWLLVSAVSLAVVVWF